MLCYSQDLTRLSFCYSPPLTRFLCYSQGLTRSPSDGYSAFSDSLFAFDTLACWFILCIVTHYNDSLLFPAILSLWLISILLFRRFDSLQNQATLMRWFIPFTIFIVVFHSRVIILIHSVYVNPNP